MLDNFSDGLLPVTKNKKLGYINAKGEEVIPCTLKYYIEQGMDDGFVIFGRFKEGLAKYVASMEKVEQRNILEQKI